MLNEVAEAEVPSEDGEVMNEPRSLAIGTEDCRRVEARPSVEVGGATEVAATEVAPIEGLPSEENISIIGCAMR
jgi:hypothetical protein